MRAFQEEVFGPVANIITFRTDDEAVALANDTEYGLSTAVISKSVGRAMAIGERLSSGLVHINDQTVNDESTNPFGGTGASGNGGAMGGPANIDEYTHWKWGRSRLCAANGSRGPRSLQRGMPLDFSPYDPLCSRSQ